MNAGADDVVLFIGAGATAAVNKLVGLLGLRIPGPLERAYGLSRAMPEGERPVVFVGPYEHHSNELPWLESVADVAPIELTVDALWEAAQTFAAGDHEQPLSEAQLAAERARYFVEATRAADDLARRWRAEPPSWNVPTGRADVDDLVWCDDVRTRGLDAPR